MIKAISLHYRSLLNALKSIITHPLENILNILVISVIIAILGAVCTVTKNLTLWEAHNVSFPQIMVYMPSNSSPADIASVETTLNKSSSRIITGYRHISKEEGLAELQQDQDLKNIASDVVADMTNTLPEVLIISVNTANPTELARLNAIITKIPLVSKVQMDSDYANKISDFMSFAHNVAGFVQILVIIVLVLVIYNMIRLQMFLREDEITVSRLIGASDSFIMRPLAYYSLLQIIIGSGIAYYLIRLFSHFLDHLFLNLNNLFGHAYLITSLSLAQFLQIFVVLLGFTFCAVFIAVRSVFKNKYTQ